MEGEDGVMSKVLLLGHQELDVAMAFEVEVVDSYIFILWAELEQRILLRSSEDGCRSPREAVSASSTGSAGTARCGFVGGCQAVKTDLTGGRPRRNMQGSSRPSDEVKKHGPHPRLSARSMDHLGCMKRCQQCHLGSGIYDPTMRSNYRTS
jgi:hypothetical protein